MESTKPGGATGCQTVTSSQVTVKEEYDGDATAGHSHHIKVKLSQTDQKKYNIYCDQPRTVLEAIKSTEDIKDPDENIVIHLGEADRKCIVATHFPCSCIRDGECLIIFTESEKVEEAQEQREIYSRDRYSVFYIDTVGGLNTKQKKLFRNNALKQFKYLCVYGEKGMTVEEALKRDGRFIDDLSNFTLSDNEDSTSFTKCTQKVDSLDQKEFKICLPRKERTKVQHANQPANQCASNDSQYSRQSVRVPASDVVQQSGNIASNFVQSRTRGASNVVEHSSGNAAAAGQQSGSSGSDAGQQTGSVIVGQINDCASRQFQNLIKWTESHFPGDSYQQALNLWREDFGKIQNSFSEVQTIKNLLNLSESVCLLNIEFFFAKIQGTGFVLFDNFILTNIHLFDECAKGPNDKWWESTTVTARFNYESDSESNWKSFNVKRVVDFIKNDQLDYAVLELEAQNKDVPQGLLKMFWKLPQNGEACIIGHPAGGVKKLDLTCIIEKKHREHAVNSNLEEYKDYLFTLGTINHRIKNYPGADALVTYNTFMYRGSSGSPVFDACGRVFALHSGGFFYGFPQPEQSVIEYAHPLLTIFEHFVSRMKDSANEEMLKRILEAAKGNPHLQEVFESVVKAKNLKLVKAEPADPEEYSDLI